MLPLYARMVQRDSSPSKVDTLLRPADDISVRRPMKTLEVAPSDNREYGVLWLPQSSSIPIEVME